MWLGNFHVKNLASECTWADAQTYVLFTVPSAKWTWPDAHFVLCPCSISFCSCQMREGLSWGNSKKSSARWDILEREKDSLQSGNHSLSFIICIRIRLESSGLQMRKCNKLLYNICPQWTDSRKKSGECAYLLLLVISWEFLFLFLCLYADLGQLK